MITVAVRDAGHSIRVWLSAAIVFVTVGFCSAVLSLMCVAIHDAQAAGLVGGESASGLWSMWGMHLVLSVVVAFVAISGTLRQVFDERSAMLARLSLAGASPAQCALMLMAQTTVAVLLGVGVGACLAWPLMTPICSWLMAHVRGLDGLLIPRYSTSAMMIALACVIGVALLAVLVRARKQLRMTPAQQVQAWRNPNARRGSWLRAVFAALLGAGLLALIWPTVVAARDRRMIMSADSFVPAGMGVSMLAAVFCVVAGPYVALGLVRLCAQVLPHGAVADMALRSFVDRPASALAAVNPMTLCIALPLGTIAPAWTLASALATHGGNESSVQADIASLIALCALPLLMAMSSALMSLVMEGRRQHATMAMGALAGETPMQQIAQQLLQSMIAVLVASAQSAFCIWLGAWWTAQVMAPTFGSVATVFPLKWWLLATLIVLAVCALFELVTTAPVAYRRAPRL